MEPYNFRAIRLQKSRSCLVSVQGTLISVPHGAPIDAQAIAQAEGLTAIVRVGVGYEDCDVGALTRAGVALVIPTAATQRPTAVAALTLILALATRLLEKHKLSSEGSEGWALRPKLQGRDLRGMVLGLVGCGAIGRELISLARPLGFTFAVHDPALEDHAVRALGAEPLPLHRLVAIADFISVHCPLTPATRHLIDETCFGLMKSDACIINTARGGVIDQNALIAALQANRIAGAGLDVFEPEPLPVDSPLLHFHNVLLSGHSLNWTRELDADLGYANCDAIATMSRGILPNGVVNRQVLDDPRFLGKLKRLAAISHSLTDSVSSN
jgi:phosphoglycerate dehydrogenase-like enzyme